MDMDQLMERFGELGYVPQSAKAVGVAAHVTDFASWPVIYTSAEDGPGGYRGFLEDLILALQRAGAVVVPRFEILRAHHNKVFAELLLQQVMGTTEGLIPACVYDVLESLDENSPAYPVVVKGYSGAGSANVHLARSWEELRKMAAKVSRFHDLRFVLSEVRRRVLWRKYGYVHTSMHRSRFLLQQFIPGMKRDYKVLVYGRKLYVLRRQTRPHDFRASGSGLFEFAPDDMPDGLLDFASRTRDALDVPLVSLDIGHDGRQFWLIEYQGLMFGPLTMEKSTVYFTRHGGTWIRVEETPDLEREFARSIHEYLASSKLSGNANCVRSG
jgi:hypothetical protein